MILFTRFCISTLFFCFAIAACNPGKHLNKTSGVDTDSIKENKLLPDAFMSSLLKSYPQFFDSILKNKKELNVQIIYTQIDRKANGNPVFTDHYFNVNANNYFYPASTVKLPVALLALQKLHELNIPGLDMNTTMITETDYSGQTPVYNDPTTEDGRPTITNYIKKILLVSDNDAFNRLYEFLGQEYINNTLHKMGYDDAQIIHRLNISLNEDENRHTNPVKFYDASGKIIYEKPAENSKLVYAQRNTKLGKGYMNGDQLINDPFDFSKKNRLSLQDLHNIVRSVIFPQMVSYKQRFNISKDDYDFVRKYMSMMPPESKFPPYDTTEFFDNYGRFLFYGAEKGSADPDIRIFHKEGDAYGFLIDAAYVADFKNKIEFMVSAEIYCNSDDIFNDDKYDYETIGYPFFKNLGHVIYNYELKRKKKYKPDLSSLRFNYSENK